jgi:hypothetical protein
VDKLDWRIEYMIIRKAYFVSVTLVFLFDQEVSLLWVWVVCGKGPSSSPALRKAQLPPQPPNWAFLWNNCLDTFWFSENTQWHPVPPVSHWISRGGLSELP